MGKTLCQQSAFKLQSDVYETFVNPEESFLEGPFYMQTTQNVSWMRPIKTNIVYYTLTNNTKQMCLILHMGVLQK